MHTPSATSPQRECILPEENLGRPDRSTHLCNCLKPAILHAV